MAEESVADSTSRRLAHLIEIRPPSFRADFVTHASPEAVSAHISQQLKRARAIEESLKWLRELQAARATQVLHGSGPERR